LGLANLEWYMSLLKIITFRDITVEEGPLLLGGRCQ
jgi:hypothetical protein